MTWLKKIALIILIVLIVIQFIRPARNSSGQVLSSDFFVVFKAPSNVRSIIENSCYDCHSNNTRYPWYSNVQPFGWLLANHIKEGKAEVNFSEFGFYSHRRQVSKLKNIEGAIKDGSMPLSSYTIIHRTAKLNAEQRKEIADWLEQTRDSLTNSLSAQ